MSTFAQMSARRGLLLLLTALLLLGHLPASALAAGAGEPVKVILQSGSASATINGQATAIAKPYTVNGTMMVPLSIITKAFGAGLKLESGKIITLTYNTTTVVLTIGSKTVKVNGKASALAAEPKVVNGVTMVPLRVIAQAFGAAIAQVPGTKQTAITGFRAGKPQAGGASSGIDADAGKSKVGDSYFGWSMNYPAGLALVDQSDNGSFSLWRDAKQSATAIVIVRELDSELTREELRTEIEKYFDEGEIVVERRSIAVDGRSVEKVVTKSRDGFFFEYRGLQHGGKVYVAAVGVKSPGKEALGSYQPLLDSFRPSFDASDANLKDITRVKNGYMAVSDEDFGLDVLLPKDWIRNTEASFPEFGGKDGYLSFVVTSLSPGDTAEKWLQRNADQARNDFLADYTRSITTDTLRLKDGVAQVLRHEYTWDKASWRVQYDVFLVAGDYRYYVTYNFPAASAAEGDQRFRTMMDSLEIDTAYIAENFSRIEDGDAMLDRTARTSKSSRKYGYSISIPSFWSAKENDFEKDTVAYTSFYGGFTVNVMEDTDASDVNASLKASLAEESAAGTDGMTNVVYGSAQVAGQTVSTFSMDIMESEDGRPYRWVMYVLEHKGNTLILNTVINLANHTDSLNKSMMDTVQSLKLN